MAYWYSCSLVRDTGPSGQTPSDNGMFTSDSCRGGWDEVGGADVLLRMMSPSVRCNVGTGSSIPELIAARFWGGAELWRTIKQGTSCLGFTEAGRWRTGGFTGSGTKRLGPPEVFPEPEATFPAPDGAAVLDSFEVLGAGL